MPRSARARVRMRIRTTLPQPLRPRPLRNCNRTRNRSHNRTRSHSRSHSRIRNHIRTRGSPGRGLRHGHRAAMWSSRRLPGRNLPSFACHVLLPCCVYRPHRSRSTRRHGTLGNPGQFRLELRLPAGKPILRLRFATLRMNGGLRFATLRTNGGLHCAMLPSTSLCSGGTGWLSGVSFVRSGEVLAMADEILYAWRTCLGARPRGRHSDP